MLSKQPVRIRRDWETGVMADCDQCGKTWQMTVPSSDGERMCAGCCDEAHLANWQSYARDLATELLSLREQLAELKALEPVAWRNRFTGYLHSNKPSIVDDCYDELFTAAKPAED